MKLSSKRILNKIKRGEKAGIVLWTGKSLYDGSPIACIATGIVHRSKNGKTGHMVQTWIIRTDIPPTDALKTGQDKAVCGECPYASGNGCYVTVFHAPLAVYKAFHNGRYIMPNEYRKSALPVVFRGLNVRIGSYGDAAAMPNIWANILKYVRGFTGYTHGWRQRPDLLLYCMASVDATDYAIAKNAGWRTFRVRSNNSDRLPNEAQCGASKEAGKVTTCADCRMCSGLWHKSNRDIVITAHGVKASRIAA